MKLIVAVLLVAISFNSVGQIDKQKLLYLGKVEKFRKMRSLGLALAVAGAGMAIYGGVKIAQDIKRYNNTGQSTLTEQDARIYVLGAPLFSAGMPLSIIGHNKMKQYEKRLIGTGVTLNLQISPHQQGLVLTYKF